MGDYKFYNYNKLGDLECTKQEEAFVNCKKILFQRMNIRTRDNNILDLILTSETSIVEDVNFLVHFAASDQT